MFLDLDRFKSINDPLGHHVRDLLPIEEAARSQCAPLRARTGCEARLAAPDTGAPLLPLPAPGG